MKNYLLATIVFVFCFSLYATSTEGRIGKDCTVKKITCSNAQILKFDCKKPHPIPNCVDKNNKFSAPKGTTNVTVTYDLNSGVNGDSPKSDKECQQKMQDCVDVTFNK